jgi:hypothetical protein
MNNCVKKKERYQANRERLCKLSSEYSQANPERVREAKKNGTRLIVNLPVNVQRNGEKTI